MSSISSKVAGAWQTITNVYTKRSGAWVAVQGIWAKQAGVWRQVYAKIKAWTQKGQTLTGRNVALNTAATRMVVGDPGNAPYSDSGSVSVYSFDGATWTPLGQTLTGGAGEGFGGSVSINSAGDRIAIGAYLAGEGYVKIYSLSGSTWVQLGQTLTITSVGDSLFGRSVSMNATGDRIVIGAPNDSGSFNTGTIRVYALSGSTWAQLGQTINPGNQGSGYSVSTNSIGDIIAIGSPSGYGGKIFVYKLITSTWTLMGAKFPVADSYNNFGYSVSLSSSGTTVIGGSPNGNLNGTKSGFFKVYQWDGTAWNQYGTTISGDINSSLGYSVSMSADSYQVGVSAPYSSGGGVGVARIYAYGNFGDGTTTWWPISPDFSNTSGSFGTSVALEATGNQIAIAGPVVKNYWLN